MGTLNPTHSLTHLLCVIKVIDLDLPKLAWQCIRIRDCIGTSVSPNGVHRRWFPIVIQCQICGGQLPPHASGWPSEEFKVHALKCELTVGSKKNVWVDLWVIEGIWSESFNSLCFGFSWNCSWYTAQFMRDNLISKQWNVALSVNRNCCLIINKCAQLSVRFPISTVDCPPDLTQCGRCCHGAYIIVNWKQLLHNSWQLLPRPLCADNLTTGILAFPCPSI